MKITYLKDRKLNDIKEAGIYFQTSNTGSTPERNYPIKQAGWLIVLYIDEMWNLQIYFPYYSEKIFTRVYYALFGEADNGWNKWVEFNGVRV